MNGEKEALELKKMTLVAWAKTLYRQGIIDLARYEKNGEGN